LGDVDADATIKHAARRYATALASLDGLSPGSYRIDVRHTRGFAWRQFAAVGTSVPPQGWKLHISLGVVDAAQSIATICQCLIAARAVFKVPDSLEGLMRLNSGAAGLTQIGKIVTVYPRDNVHLRRIVRSTAGLSFNVGPTPPLDRPLRGFKGQSIRFGVFGGAAPAWTSLGRPYSVLVAAGGRQVEDARDSTDLTTESQPPLPTIRAAGLGRLNDLLRIDEKIFVPISLLSNSARFRVDLAINLASVESCVVKRARPKVGDDLLGNSAERRLANEAAVLSALNDCGIGPQLLAYSDKKATLVMSDVPGVAAEGLEGPAKLRAIAKAAEAMARLHERGIVHRDAKLANCIVDSRSGDLVFLDFELSATIGTKSPIAGGTPGYIPPEGLFVRVEPSYDVFALGSSLAQWALNVDPSRLPPSQMQERIRSILQNANRPCCERIYRRLSHPNPRRRPSAEEAARLLRRHHSALIRESRRRPSTPPEGELRHWASGVGARALPALRQFSRFEGGQCTWRNNHVFADAPCESINLGSAGILIGLIHVLANGCRDQLVWDLIEGTSRKLLAASQRFSNPGLFTGACGAAVALAAAGRCLGSDEAMNHAMETVERASRASATKEWDLFSGAAGIVLAGTWVAALAREPNLVDTLQAPVTRLIRARRGKKGITSWRSTDAYDPTRRSYLGAAHGASGVALSLAAWARASSNDSEATAVAREIFQGIHRDATTAGRWNIAETAEGGARPPQYWCHGVAGYLWCLLQSFPDDELLAEPRRWALQAFRKSTPLLDLVPMCHGLSGILDTWQLVADWAQARRDRALDVVAKRECAQVVNSLRYLEQEYCGGMVWSAEDPAEITPDLWVGFMGPVATISQYAAGRTGAILSLESISESVRRVETGRMRVAVAAPR